MHTPTLAVALTGISLALANPAADAAPQPIITPGALAARQFVATASHTGALSQSIACQRSLLSLVDTVPTPPARVVSWLATAVTVPALDDPSALTDDSLTTLCDATRTITPPASLTAAYSSYTHSMSEWASSNARAANSVASSCGGLESALIKIQIATDSESCTSAVQDLLEVARAQLLSSSSPSSSVGTVTQTGSVSSEETSTAAATGTETSGGSGESSTDGAEATSSSSTAGAAVGPKETGLVAAVAAAAVGIAGVVAAL
ncbi:uncharacterized protein B0T15DRAFT_495544 [Chaetomium strumarium]|uniref:Infection structure specific protein n=1 Tax=Chaetomium strumarium TaxID=1170767 RepID=A0AAJ0GMZ8_9PEZI|nr:hypothetical protein B0T15DRAFT_495544 [Chaetomium strumarium]